MNNPMMNYFMARDGRNPYGSRGGYVTSYDPRRRDRAMRGHEDYARGREDDYARSGRNYDRASDYNYDRNYERENEDYARGGRGSSYGSNGDGSYYPFEVRGSFGGGEYDPYIEEMMMYEMMDGRRRRNARGQFMRDGHGMGERYLPREELYDWCERLKGQIDEKDKQLFSKENILKKAEELGIKFGDEYTKEEFEVAVLMVYTDYCKTLGSASMDTYIRLAKDWLEDKDSALKGGEKLASYFYNVING